MKGLGKGEKGDKEKLLLPTVKNLSMLGDDRESTWDQKGMRWVNNTRSIPWSLSWKWAKMLFLAEFHN